MAAIAAAPPVERPGVGLGRTLAFELAGAGGTALVHDGETAQLTACADERLASRIRRPARCG